MPRLPGQMAALSTHMDGVKANLMRLHDAIQHLAGTAAAGDFCQCADAQAFDHGFRAMVEQLNALMTAVVGHLDEQSGFPRALASGDLGARLAGAAQVSMPASSTMPMSRPAIWRRWCAPLWMWLAAWRLLPTSCWVTAVPWPRTAPAGAGPAGRCRRPGRTGAGRPGQRRPGQRGG